MLSDDPLYKYDDHAVHYEVHRRYILSSEFLHLDMGVQEVAIAHCDTHKAMMDVVAQEEQMKAAYMTGNAARVGTEASAPDIAGIAEQGGPPMGA